jgi:hypothetical protein
VRFFTYEHFAPKKVSWEERYPHGPEASRAHIASVVTGWESAVLVAMVAFAKTYSALVKRKVIPVVHVRLEWYTIIVTIIFQLPFPVQTRTLQRHFFKARSKCCICRQSSRMSTHRPLCHTEEAGVCCNKSIALPFV